MPARATGMGLSAPSSKGTVLQLDYSQNVMGGVYMAWAKIRKKPRVAGRIREASVLQGGVYMAPRQRICSARRS
jgi:hypothetical protein